MVTGAARGIGQAIALGLAERGARIVLGDVGDMSETSDLIADTGRKALPVTLDVSDPALVEAARGRVSDELGRVDILVNNAGIFEAATWDDLDFDLWKRVMAVDLNCHIHRAPRQARRMFCAFAPPASNDYLEVVAVGTNDGLLSRSGARSTGSVSRSSRSATESAGRLK